MMLTVYYLQFTLNMKKNKRVVEVWVRSMCGRREMEARTTTTATVTAIQTAYIRFR